jgi:vacuolar-type H+-ATPase subunit I/STV1
MEISMSRKNHKAFALPTSPVLMNESADDLDRVRETLNNEIKPRGMIEQLYLLDYAELTFEVLRLRRWKMALLNKNFVPALEAVFTQLLQHSGYNYGEASATAKDIAHRWFIDKEVKKYGKRLLRQCRLDVSAIEVEAFRKSADEIELIDKLLASAESRRNKIIREMAAYRNGLAQQLEKSANRIIEAEVLTHDDAVKNAVVEQADDAVKNAVVEQADDAVKNAVVEQAEVA